MDKAWKKHERDVAGFFGTQRALHGIDRDQGDVQTDVFVDGRAWNQHLIDSNKARPLSFCNYAFFIECKYTKKGASSNSWMVRALDKIHKEPVMKTGVMPILVTRDGWHWVQLPYFHLYLDAVRTNHMSAKSVISMTDVRHVNKDMSTFFANAIAQATLANLPYRAGDTPYSHRFHAVCVGTNERMVKCIGIPPSPLDCVELK